jgi:hypothetical protein
MRTFSMMQVRLAAYSLEAEPGKLTLPPGGKRIHGDQIRATQWGSIEAASAAANRAFRRLLSPARNPSRGGAGDVPLPYRKQTRPSVSSHRANQGTLPRLLRLGHALSMMSRRTYLPCIAHSSKVTTWRTPLQTR